MEWGGVDGEGGHMGWMSGRGVDSCINLRVRN